LVERLAQNPYKTECFHFPLFPSESWWKVLMSAGRGDNHRADAVLSATSQQKDPLIRNVSRSAKIRTRLGRGLDLFGPIPARPRGMWRRTYEHHCVALAGIEGNLFARPTDGGHQDNQRASKGRAPGCAA
jgi:hypothetical protein